MHCYDTDALAERQHNSKGNSLRFHASAATSPCTCAQSALRAPHRTAAHAAHAASRRCSAGARNHVVPVQSTL